MLILYTFSHTFSSLRLVLSGGGDGSKVTRGSATSFSFALKKCTAQGTNKLGAFRSGCRPLNEHTEVRAHAGACGGMTRPLAHENPFCKTSKALWPGCWALMEPSEVSCLISCV